MIVMRYLGTIIAISTIYYLGAWLGLNLFIPQTNVGLIWPPVGIMVALFLIFGYRLWPAVLFGAFAVNFPANLKIYSFLTSLAIGSIQVVANLGQVLVAVWAYRRLTGKDRSIDTIKDVLIFVAVAAIVSQMLGATVGVSGLYLGGKLSWDDFGVIWRTWFFSNMLSVLIITPFILFWGQSWKRPSAEQFLSSLLIYSVTFLTANFIFNGLGTHGDFKYLTLLLVILSSIVLGQRGSSMVSLLIASVALWKLATTAVPVAVTAIADSVILIEIYLAVVALAGLILATVLKERKELGHEVQKWAHIFENIDWGVVVGSADGKKLELVNPGYAKMLGYTVEELQGRPILDIYAPEYRKEIPHYIDLCHQFGRYAFEARHLRKDGTTFPVFVDITAVKDEAGNVLYRAGHIQDITQRKEAEESLKSNEAYYRSIFENSLYGIASSGLDMRFIQVNDAFCKMMEYSREELLGLMGIAEITYPDDRMASKEMMQKVSNHEREKFLIEKRYLTKSGRIIEAMTFVQGIYDQNGKYAGGTASIMDVTEKNKSEKRLQNAQKLEALGVLAGGIAHDFNNLLGGIFGYIDLARMRCQSKRFDDVPAYLSNAMTMFNRARDLSQQLLTFSKGGGPLIKSQPLEPLVRRSAQFMLSGSNLKVNFDIPRGLWPCNIDENQIGQVIDNIVINAKQAMPTGGVIIISARNISSKDKKPLELKGDRYVCVAIKDSGIGIGPEHLSRIFDPFYTTKQQGSGLGLAMAYSIIKKHDGAIEVESVLTKGSTFFLYLPASTEVSASSVAEEQLTFSCQKKVLIMDDESTLLDLFSAIFQELGCEVECCRNADEAMAMFTQAQKSSHPFEIVMLDLTIPGGIGGKETVLSLRKINPNFLAIACSGHSSDPVMSTPQQFAFDSALPKPFQQKDLIKILRDKVKDKT